MGCFGSWMHLILAKPTYGLKSLLTAVTALSIATIPPLIASEPLGLKATSSYRANIAANQTLYEQQSTSVGKGGALTLKYPYNAGVMAVGACTVFKLDEIGIISGGLVVDVSIKQKLFCPQPHFSTFSFRPRTNQNTEYRFNSNGHVAIVKGTIGGIGAIGQTTYVGITEGEVLFQHSTGQAVTITAGQIIEATPTAVRLNDLPPPTISTQHWGSKVIVTTHPSSILTIDGQNYYGGKAIVYAPKIIIVQNIAGQRQIYNQINYTPR